jgi:hypothetical protein
VRNNEKLRGTLDFLSRYLTILLLIAVLALISGFIEGDAKLALAGGLGGIALVVVIWGLERPIESLEGTSGTSRSPETKGGVWWFLGPLIGAVALLAMVESSMDPSGVAWDALRLAVSIGAILAIGSALIAAWRN